MPNTGKIYMAMADEHASGITLYQFGSFTTDSVEKTLRVTVSRHLNDPWNDSQIWTVVKMWDSHNTEDDYQYMRQLFEHIGQNMGIMILDKKRGIYHLEDQQIIIAFLDELFSSS